MRVLVSIAGVYSPCHFRCAITPLLRRNQCRLESHILQQLASKTSVKETLHVVLPYLTAIASQRFAANHSPIFMQSWMKNTEPDDSPQKKQSTMCFALGMLAWALNPCQSLF